MSADFTEKLEVANWPECLEDAALKMRERGATWLRATHPTMTSDIVILEGWRERPEDEGPPPEWPD